MSQKPPTISLVSAYGPSVTAIFPPSPRRTRPSPARSFSPFAAPPDLRSSSAQLMYFWMTFCISCGLSVLGMPELRATTRYFAMVGLLILVRLRRRRTGAGVVDTLIRLPPHPALSPGGGEGIGLPSPSSQSLWGRG